MGFGPGLGPQPQGYLGPAPRRVRSQGPCPWGSCLARSDRSTAEPRPHRPRGGSVGSPQGRGGGCWSPSPESCVSAAAGPEASATSVPGRSVTSLRSSGLSGGHPPPSPPASRGRFWARVLPSTRPAALVLRPPSRPPAEHAPQACPLPGALTSPLTLAASSLPPTPRWGLPPNQPPEVRSPQGPASSAAGGPGVRAEALPVTPRASQSLVMATRAGSGNPGPTGWSVSLQRRAAPGTDPQPRPSGLDLPGLDSASVSREADIAHLGLPWGVRGTRRRKCFLGAWRGAGAPRGDGDPAHGQAVWGRGLEPPVSGLNSVHGAENRGIWPTVSTRISCGYRSGAAR